MGETFVTSFVIVLVLLAIIAIVALALLYAQLQSQHVQIQSQYERSQTEYADTQSQYIRVQTQLNDLAREQFTAWRDKELETVRQHLREAAWNETITKAQAWLAENQKRIREEFHVPAG